MDYACHEQNLFSIRFFIYFTGSSLEIKPKKMRTTALAITVLLAGCAAPGIRYQPSEGKALSAAKFKLITKGFPFVLITRVEIEDCKNPIFSGMGRMDSDTKESSTKIESGDRFNILFSAYQIPPPGVPATDYRCFHGISFIPSPNRSYEIETSISPTACHTTVYDITSTPNHGQQRILEISQSPIHRKGLENEDFCEQNNNRELTSTFN
jgi:hypothetical protein